MSDPLQFFTVWYVEDGNCGGYALDAYPEEIEPYRREMTCNGDHFAGPFHTEAEAQAVVESQMMRWLARNRG